MNKTYYRFGQKVLSFWVKSTIVLLKTEVCFTKNGGTFHQKRRYVLLKMEVRFTKNGGTFYKKPIYTPEKSYNCVTKMLEWEN